MLRMKSYTNPLLIHHLEGTYLSIQYKSKAYPTQVRPFEVTKIDKAYIS